MLALALVLDCYGNDDKGVIWDAIIRYITAELTAAIKVIKKGRAFLRSHQIEDLEIELTNAVYQQRSNEDYLILYEPQSSAPRELIANFISSKLKVQELELKIRHLKYRY